MAYITFLKFKMCYHFFSHCVPIFTFIPNFVFVIFNASSQRRPLKYVYPRPHKSWIQLREVTTFVLPLHKLATRLQQSQVSESVLLQITNVYYQAGRGTIPKPVL